MLERKVRILDAAERLIRETGETDFSVRNLAAAAEVSPATPFNLFGSKEGLLYELLLRSLDTVTREGLVFKSKDSAMHALEAVENAVDFFLNDPVFLRPLYRVLMGANHPEHRTTFMEGTYSYWQRAADTVIDASSLKDERTRNAVTISLMSHFIGLLEMWVQGDLDDKAFMNSSKLGVMLILFPFVSAKNQKRLMGIFNELKEDGVRLTQ
jgi:AcrR family transcriptional regulator